MLDFDSFKKSYIDLIKFLGTLFLLIIIISIFYPNFFETVKACRFYILIIITGLFIYRLYKNCFYWFKGAK